jgi:hypothetical protein
VIDSAHRRFPMLSTLRLRGRLACAIGSLLVIPALVFVGCGPPTQHEILKKAEGVETKQDLEAALGAPDAVDKLGPIERWTYSASDGQVEYVITGDSVALESTKKLEEEPKQEGEPASP